MANNRMIIRCVHCDDTKVLAKYSVEVGLYFFALADDADDAIVEYDNWFNDHMHGRWDLIGPTHFSLEFEHNRGDIPEWQTGKE